MQGKGSRRDVASNPSQYILPSRALNCYAVWHLGSADRLERIAESTPLQSGHNAKHPCTDNTHVYGCALCVDVQQTRTHAVIQPKDHDSCPTGYRPNGACVTQVGQGAAL